jgi:hypothetical protein
MREHQAEEGEARESVVLMIVVGGPRCLRLPADYDRPFVAA